MKFGQDFHRHQVPEWASLYMPYNRLKRLLKDEVRASKEKGAPPDFTELYWPLKESIDMWSNFHASKHRHLTERASLIRTYDKQQPQHPIPITKFENYLKTIDELQRELHRLSWFSTVNSQAFSRIYTKIDKQGAFSDVFQTQRSALFDDQGIWALQCVSLTRQLDNMANELDIGVDAPVYEPNRESRLRFAPLVGLYRAIKHNQVPVVSDLVRQEVWKINPNIDIGLFFQGLVRFAVTDGSADTVEYLLFEAFPQLWVHLDFSLLNTLTIIMGHQKTSPQSDGTLSADCEAIVSRAIRRFLSEDIDDMLSYVNETGGSPLHHAAFYGLAEICKSILYADPTRSVDCGEVLMRTRDQAGYTPLEYAVIGNHKSALEVMLSTLRYGRSTELDKRLQIVLHGLVCVAMRYQYDEVFSLLLALCTDLSQTRDSETVLYVAAQTGRVEFVKAILEKTPCQIDTPETVRGWTPLFIACVEGHQAVVQALIEAGANQDIEDKLGWTAREHAAFRGHLSVAEGLNKPDSDSYTGGPAATKHAPVDSHAPAGDQSQIIVNLGVLQTNKDVKAVDLISAEGKKPLHQLKFEISCSGAKKSYTVQLPLLSDTVNEPFVFLTRDPDNASLSFKLSSADEKGQLLGSATALLGDKTGCFGAMRESLVRERTVPILEATTLDVMGTLTFTMVVSKPFPGSLPLSPKPFIPGPLRLVGHRGFGQNVAGKEFLQLGENTIESFLSATRLGALYVEFDVQLTRDLVPIVYHDFSLSESGTDIPIHDLSLDQFLHASTLQLPPEPTHTKPRSRSVSQSPSQESPSARMKHTVDYLEKGFKPNTRGTVIHGPFTTLEELLTTLPESISFNIEIKYPRLHEASDAGIAPTGLEINTFVDKTLEKVFSLANQRNIILSSFTPEICILLSLKQQIYPVMFITNAGRPPMTDMEVRAGSLQAAVRFARRWNLAGVVFACEVLLLCPRLIGYVQRAGLVCGSYGLLNNKPELAKAQADAGIDLLMADRVGLISSVLSGTFDHKAMN